MTWVDPGETLVMSGGIDSMVFPMIRLHVMSDEFSAPIGQQSLNALTAHM